jgi:uncharacterized protein (DUF2235 family)
MSDAPAEFPDWVVAALNSKVSPPSSAPVASVASHRGGSAWPLLMDAAVVGPFLPRDLGRQAGRDDERRAAERTLLDFAETTLTPHGAKWILLHDARVAVLNASGAGDELQRAIDRTRTKFTDPFSVALRRYLESAGAVDETTDLATLEATRTAVAALEGVTTFTLPSLDDLDREVEFARLLAQFARMTGEVPGKPGSDRFFGRDTELKTLRDYCEGIDAESYKTQLTRVIQRARRTGIVPHVVSGVGGVGKTTLVAKFMLEHVRAGRSRWPFAYLDFDRSTVNASHLTALLAEMCAQVATQFADLSQPMTEMRDSLQTLAAKTEALSGSEVIPLLRPYAQKFCDHIDRLIEGGDRLIAGLRPFLLVFDTFEVVQYEAGLVRHLEEFVAAFSPSSSSRPWGRLRLIVSGRRAVPSFLGEVVQVPLGPLDAAGSASMLKALASDSEVALSEGDANVIVNLIARQVSGKPGAGVHPLQLRLVGTVIAQMKKECDADNGSFSIQTLIAELNQPNATKLTGRTFINGILVRRILGHVVDSRVRALADPGLVVRRITPDVIREVMAPSTNPPGPGGTTDDSDVGVRTPWRLTAEEASEIYDAFSREVTLIEHDGDALRHRPDVRQEMLPLIRARRPMRYADMHRRAFAHFAEQLRQDQSDDRAAAEAIYHGLWSGQSLGQLHRWWRTDGRFNPRIDAEEFEAGSPANVFVQAKGLADLSGDEVRLIPPEVTLDWLAGRTELLLQVDRVNHETMSMVRAAAGENLEGLDDRPGLAATVARLLYRSGEWQDAVRLLSRILDRPAARVALSSPSEDNRESGYWSLLRTWVSIVSKSGRGPNTIEQYAAAMEGTPDPLARAEFVVHRALAMARLDERSFAREHWRANILDALRQVPQEQWRVGMRTLRLAILLLGEQEEEWVLRYARAIDGLPRDRDLDATVEVMLGASLRDWKRERFDAGKRIEGITFAEIDDLWQSVARERFVKSGAREKTAFITMLVEDHREWVRPIGNALTRELAGVSGPELQAWLQRSGFAFGAMPGADEDGLSYAQTAYENGRFRELVLGLRSVGARHQQGFGGQQRQPDVFQLANAFDECRETLLRIVARGKSIILFSNGTAANIAKLFKTNVWRMYEAVDLGPAAEGRRTQIAYYDGFRRTLVSKPMASFAGAFGWGLKQSVLDSYRFACRKYRAGDEIYAFGFGRGGFTMRLVIALIASEGLVQSSSEAELHRKSLEVYRKFRAAFLPRHLKWPTRLVRGVRDWIDRGLSKFRGYEPYDPADNRWPKIRFIGIWDTVSAYGGPLTEVTRVIDNWIFPLSMPNYQLNEHVQCARHALAIDDERDAFHPLLWDELHEKTLVAQKRVNADRLEQVWFTGTHDDVGGGYPDDNLSYVPLLWMMEEAEIAGLRTLTVIKDRYLALASSFGPIHDSRAGLRAYYRYQPRKIAAWLDPVDRGTQSLRDPAIVDSAGRPRGLLSSVSIHESVINKIATEEDYAPITLPTMFRIVPPGLEGETIPQADSQMAELNAPGTLVSRELRRRLNDPEAAESRTAVTEPIWDYVWWRRLTYFTTVTATLVLLCLPMLVGVLPRPPFLAGGATLIEGTLRLLASILPFGGTWVQAYADNLYYFLLLGGIIVLFYSLGKWLERTLRDKARRVWSGAIRDEPLPEYRVSLVQRLRTSYGYQRFIQLLRWSLIPNVIVAPLLGWLSVWLGLAVFVQTTLPSFENGNVLCKPSQSTVAEITTVARDFRTRDVCGESFGLVHERHRYIVTFDVVDPWYDAGLAASPEGIPAREFPAGLGYLAAPFKRVIDANYLQPLIEIRQVNARGLAASGNIQIYPLSVQLVGDTGTLFRGDFTAAREGDLFLFVNDAMIPLTSSQWGQYNYRYFYEASGGGPLNERGNRGTACVTVESADATKRPMVQAPAGSICEKAALRNSGQM